MHEQLTQTSALLRCCMTYKVFGLSPFGRPPNAHWLFSLSQLAPEQAVTCC